jgi:Rrf2 family protein
MLSISNKSKYGLKAALALASSYEQGGLLSIREIAAQQNIPRQFLEQILNRLARASIVASVRGKQGGYRLARPPARITAAEIVTLLEGGIDLAPGRDDPGDVVAALFNTAQEDLLRALEISLSDLAGRQQQHRGIPMYTI